MSVDAFFLLCGWLTGRGVGIGTVICLFLVGPVAGFFLPRSEKRAKLLVGNKETRNRKVFQETAHLYFNIFSTDKQLFCLSVLLFCLFSLTLQSLSVFVLIDRHIYIIISVANLFVLSVKFGD